MTRYKIHIAFILVFVWHFMSAQGTLDVGIDHVRMNVVNLGPDTTICAGQCVYMEGPTGYTNYVWYENGLVYSTGFWIEPCPTTDSEYKLVAVDGAGGVYQDSTMVYVDPTPIVNLQPTDTTIFIGDTVVLYGAEGNFSWEWWVADTLYDTTQNIEVSPTSTTTYVHYAYNSYGCAGVDSIIVIVDPHFLGPDRFLCEGSCDTLSGPPNMMAYVWYENGALQTWPDSEVEVCPEVTTEYVLRILDHSGNAYQDTIIVNVMSLPDVSIQPANDTIIYGESLELSVDTIYNTYQWYEEDTLLPDTTNWIIVQPILDSVQYTVFVSDTNQCVGEDSTYVFVIPFSFDLGPDDTICQYIEYQLVGPADMVEYLWYADTSLLPYTTDTIYVTPDSTTMYTLRVENDLGVTAEDSLTLTVFPSPMVEFENDTIRSCFFNTLELEVSSSGEIDNYFWEYNGMVSTTTENLTSFEDITDSAYAFVTAYSLNECDSKDSVYVAVSDYPIITIIDDTVVCAGEEIELFASGAYQYFWVQGNDTISTDSIAIVAPMDTTEYIVYAADSSTVCFVSDTVVVATTSNAGTKIIYTDTTVVCSNYTIELKASGAESYIWVPSGETDTVYNLKIISDTTIYLVGDNLSGCSSTDSMSFTVIPSPESYIEPLSLAYCLTDAPVVLFGSPEGGTFGGAGTISGMFYPNVAGSGEHAVYYKVQSTENECFGYDTTFTTVYGDDSEIDLGDDFTLIYTEERDLNAGAGFDSYYWNTGETTQIITVTGSDYPTGTFEYTVVGVVSGCSTPGSVFITFEGPDNIEENTLTGISIYPNPNTGDFVVEFKSDEQKFDILIYDMQGVVVFKEENISCKDDCRATVELTSLRQGIYLIKAMTYNSVRTSKIILK